MVPSITVHALARALAERGDIVLLDVRQPEEHALAALPGSVLIPMNELPQRAGEITPPERGLVVVYCHHGIRSVRAAQFLIQQGLEAVSLAGGIDAWSREIDPNLPRY